MKVFTYYNMVPELDPIDETKLILLWLDRWNAIGHDACVISEPHAANHVDYDKFKKAVMHLPSVNPAGYETACYLRWLAVAASIREGEIVAMADYDVMPYGDGDLEKYVDPRRMVFLQKYVPALVIGTKKQFNQQATKFSLYKYKDKGALNPEGYSVNGKAHTSDQNICAEQVGEGKNAFAPLDVMKSYTEAGWETAPFVHYNNGSMVPNGKTPRWKHIPLLR